MKQAKHILPLSAGALSALMLNSCSEGQNNELRQAKDKPNIIILFADDMGYGDLACYGNPVIKTPHLDRMAGEGMKFTEFYSACSVSTPSRASLLTGRLPLRTGMISPYRHVLFSDSKLGLPHEELTIAEVLKDKGYATACIGKWHLGHLQDYLPYNHGFDYYYGLPYSNDMSASVNPRTSKHNKPPIPLIENKEVIDLEPDQRYLTRDYTYKALEFIRKHKEQPFFVYLPYTMPHVPLYVSPEMRGKSRRGLYGDVIEEVDWSVGMILDYLRQNNLAENTLVFFTSDNGPWLIMDMGGGSAGLLSGGKQTHWEGGFRVPGIAWWPGTIEAGSICREVACTMDMLPTIAGIVGYELPEGKTYDGTDIMPLLMGKEEALHEDYFYYNFSILRAVRHNQYKVHIDYDAQTEQDVVPGQTEWWIEALYDLRTDPGEHYNIMDQHPGLVAEMEEIIRRHHAEMVPGENRMDARIDLEKLDIKTLTVED